MPEVMTPQETFDAVVSGLIKQGHPSIVDGKCAYRGENGAKCAVGFLIPDELYESLMEQQSVLALMYQYPRLADFLLPNEELLSELQFAHDDWAEDHPNRSAFLQDLRQVAEKHGLDPGIIDRTPWGP